MNIQIEDVTQLPADIQALGKKAQSEGYSFINRMIEEFENGLNRFDHDGEFLLMVYDNQKLIGCGGLNQQKAEDDDPRKIGRLRRFYILPKYRKKGIGKILLQHLEKRAVKNFSALCLKTDTQSAAHFYQKMNYVHVENYDNYNYFKYLIK